MPVKERAGRALDRSGPSMAVSTTTSDVRMVRALPADEEDVAALVRFARERGLQVTSRPSGHLARPLEGTLLVDTSALAGVEIDAAAGRARVRAGARWGEVAEHASMLGLAPLAGLSPDACVVADSLRGGVGWLARKHGLQSNSVTTIEVVTADGRLVRIDHANEPELFWALRGGGGDLGVVTAIELQLHPVGELYAGALFFPLDRTRQVLQAWREWTATLPDELTSIARVLRVPNRAAVPEQLRGRSCAVVEAACLGDAGAAGELLQPLRELGPCLDTFARIPPAALSRLHLEPDQPLSTLTDHLLTADLPEVAIDALVDVAGMDGDSPLDWVELRHLGGELARCRPGAGALASVDASYLLHAVGVPRDAAHSEAIRARLADVTSALAHYGTGSYLNLVARPADPRRALGPDVLRRLRAARNRYDPMSVFCTDAASARRWVSRRGWRRAPGAAPAHAGFA
jgi:FAD binding domain-containing protein